MSYFDVSGVGYPDISEFDTIQIERLRVVARTALSPQVADDAEWVTMVDAMTQRMIFELRSSVMCQRLDKGERRVVFSYPATWWDALKRDLAEWESKRYFQHRFKDSVDGKAALPPTRLALRVLRWWLPRHPVRETAKAFHVECETLATFPENTMRFPDELGRPILHRHITTRVES